MRSMGSLGPKVSSYGQRRLILLVLSCRGSHARSILTLPLHIFFSNRTSLPDYESFKTICAYMVFSDRKSEDCILGEVNVEKLVIAENI